MKKLGLIGGMGPQSTMPYYMNIVTGVQQRTSPRFFPNLTIESLNVFEILDMIDKEQYDELTVHFTEALNRLKAAGAEFAALTANTAHIVYDRLKEVSPLPLVSIIEATVNEAKAQSYRKVALLGTIFTMEREFYKQPFVHADIEIFTPDKEDRIFLDRKISEELEFGVVNPDTQNAFVQIIKRMQTEHGIDAVILGCTELPLILNNEISPVPCLDTVKIHSEALVNEILQK